MSFKNYSIEILENLTIECFSLKTASMEENRDFTAYFFKFTKQHWLLEPTGSMEEGMSSVNNVLTILEFSTESLIDSLLDIICLITSQRCENICKQSKGKAIPV